MAETTMPAADDLFVRSPEPVRVTVEYTVARRWPWPHLARVRRTYELYPLPLFKLMAIDAAYDESRKLHRSLTLLHLVAPIIGSAAREMPAEVLQALWDAHAKANLIPKAGAARTAAPVTERSSDDSSSTTDSAAGASST